MIKDAQTITLKKESQYYIRVIPGLKIKNKPFAILTKNQRFLAKIYEIKPNRNNENIKNMRHYSQLC